MSCMWKLRSILPDIRTSVTLKNFNTIFHRFLLIFCFFMTNLFTVTIYLYSCSVWIKILLQLRKKWWKKVFKFIIFEMITLFIFPPYVSMLISVALYSEWNWNMLTFRLRQLNFISRKHCRIIFLFKNIMLRYWFDSLQKPIHYM